MAAPVLPLLALLLFGVGILAGPEKRASGVKVESQTVKKVDLEEMAKQVVQDVRDFADAAKRGMTLANISEGAREIEEGAAEFLALLPKQADSCQANLVIKMAAARTGSHEILTLLQAADPLDVLNGRLSLSLAFLESVVQLMEDELPLSEDIQGHLAAIVFGADMTDTIVETTDELLNQTLSTSNDNSALRKRSWDLSASPTIDGGNLGVKGSATWTNKKGNTKINLSPSWNSGTGFGGGASISFTW